MLSQITPPFSTLSVVDPREMHCIPSGFTTLSIQELAQERVNYIHNTPHPEVGELRNSVWGGHFTTHTFLLRTNNHVHLFEDKELFSNSKAFDYDQTKDGGVPIIQSGYEFPDSTRTIQANIYDNCKGGNFLIDELLEHPIIQELIPDKLLRKKYKECMQYLDKKFVFSESGKGSIWTAPEMRPGYARAYGLGFGGKAFYPQNPETKNHSIILKVEVVNS